jgi:hypothetical protein
MSWQDVTSAVADGGADEIAVAALGHQIDRWRRAFGTAEAIAHPGRLAEMAAVAADQDDGVTGIGAADAGHVDQLSIRPTPPMVGVGRIASPLVSL